MLLFTPMYVRTCNLGRELNILFYFVVYVIVLR